MKKSPKIIFRVDGFPKPSETFVIDHITLAIDSGYDILIYPNKIYEKTNSSQPWAIENYNLFDRIIPPTEIPNNNLGRFTFLLKLIISSRYHRINFLKSMWINRREHWKLYLFHYLETLPFLNHSDTDIIHVHFGHLSRGIALGKKAGLITSKLVTTFHGYDAYPDIAGEISLKKYYKVVFENSEILTVNTPYLREELQKIGAKNVNILPMGVNLTFFNPIPKKQSHNSKNINLISIGRLVKWKNHLSGLKVIKLLKEKHEFIHYYIVGEGSEYPTLEKFIKENQLEKDITLLGKKNLNEIKLLLHNSDIFLMTSSSLDGERKETQGVVSIEAQAAGLPIVAFDSGGVKYTMIPNHTGYLAAEGNLEQYAQYVSYLIQNPKIRKQFGENARLFIENSYDNRICSKKLTQIYNQALHHASD